MHFSGDSSETADVISGADAKRAKELAEMQEKLDKDKQEHTEKAARNADDLAAAKQEVGRLAAEHALEQGATPTGSVEFRPGSVAWQAASTLVQYVSNPAVRAALLDAGMPPEQESMAATAAEAMRAAASAADASGITHAATGHRPPGTVEAAAAMVEEAAAEAEMEDAVEELEEMMRGEEL